MLKLSAVLVEFDGEPAFWCPGCQYMHRVWVHHPEPGNGALWTWNGDAEKPTFRASILIPGSGKERDHRCHSFVTEGRIQFLLDSTHSLSGQTVDLPPWPVD